MFGFRKCRRQQHQPFDTSTHRIMKDVSKTKIHIHTYRRMCDHTIRTKVAGMSKRRCCDIFYTKCHIRSIEL